MRRRLSRAVYGYQESTGIANAVYVLIFTMQIIPIGICDVGEVVFHNPLNRWRQRTLNGLIFPINCEACLGTPMILALM